MSKRCLVKEGKNAPFFSSVSSSSKNEGTWTTTPDPMNAVHSGLTRPGEGERISCVFLCGLSLSSLEQAQSRALPSSTSLPASARTKKASPARPLPCRLLLVLCAFTRSLLFLSSSQFLSTPHHSQPSRSTNAPTPHSTPKNHLETHHWGGGESQTLS